MSPQLLIALHSFDLLVLGLAALANSLTFGWLTMRVRRLEAWKRKQEEKETANAE